MMSSNNVRVFHVQHSFSLHFDRSKEMQPGIDWPMTVFSSHNFVVHIINLIHIINHIINYVLF